MIEVISSGGAIQIPMTYAELLKPVLFFWHKWTPTVKTKIPDRDNPGEWIEINKRSKVPKIDRVELYSETEQGLITHNGLFHRVEKTLVDAGYEVSCVRRDIPFASPVPTPFVVEGLYEEQKNCVCRLLSTFSGGMTENATGTGKTRVIGALCRAYPNSRILIVTRKRPVVSGLYEELNKLVPPTGYTGKPMVGIYKPGKKRGSERINVCTSAMMVASVPKDWPDVIIFDECHGAAGDETARALSQFVNAVKYGLSGTILNRWDGKERLLESLFGPIVFRLSDIQATSMGRVVPLDVFVMRNGKGPRVNSVNPATQERQGITENQTRNLIIREVVEYIPPDDQVIVFVRTLEHGEHLQSKYLAGFEMFHGALDPKDYTRLLAGIVSGELKRVIATNTIGEGVDPKNLRWVIDADWSSSRTSCIQRVGRNRRFAPGKERGYVVAFSDEFDDRFAAKAATRLNHYKRAGYSIWAVTSVSEIIQHIDNVCLPITS